MAEGRVEVFKPAQEWAGLVSASNPIVRQDLISTPEVWMGVAHTFAGVASAWHHHSDNDTYGYVISGRLSLQFGPGGKESAEVGPGEVFHVPKRLVHRETTVGTEPGVIFVVRVGSGEPVVNVDQPDRS